MIYNITTYFDNTKDICIYIAISLLLILFSCIAPINIYKPILILIKLLIIFILSFSLYKNTTESITAMKNINNFFDGVDQSSMRNNILMSYLLSVIILFLIINIARSIFL